MKRFILLFVMAVFTVMVISSCAENPSMQSAPSPKKVTIKIKHLEPSPGNRPDVVPRCVELKLPKDIDGVEWNIDKEVKFTITFDENEHPFKEWVFTNEGNISEPVMSGPVVVEPGDADLIYKYTLEVKGYVTIDPAVIVFN